MAIEVDYMKMFAVGDTDGKGDEPTKKGKPEASVQKEDGKDNEKKKPDEKTDDVPKGWFSEKFYDHLKEIKES